ncbi:Hypothetical protein PMT_2319 [Prochlorococcus marinus str. MIT 9313]|uniref:Uncharacterized protein n=1 Tax=Prochlorococcus marinus (strain MIT 9313) TaxID=74547 RepID=B9ERF1_PROMM|nr:Hypothetical protein PMT_2319 [Prochlorococcus marinus str. MIT 9313]
MNGSRGLKAGREDQPTTTPVQLIPQQPRESLTPEELIIRRFFDALD